MALDIARELAAMRRMTVTQLRARYVEVIGEPTRSSNRQHLIRRLAWRLQALEEGSLSDRAVQRAAELANEADIRLTAPRPRNPRNPPRPGLRKGPVSEPEPVNAAAFRDRRLPPPGNVIARVYKGRQLRVTVLEDGFEHEGIRHRTLSAAAKAITGCHLNGYAFFGLGPKRAKRANKSTKGS